eukprot:31566-Pelagococcus_subviridis.AAC.26
MIKPRTGRWYGRFPNGCSICSAAASVPNSASDSSAVVGTTANAPTSCTRMNGNVHTYTMSVDLRCEMMHPGGGCMTTFSHSPYARMIPYRSSLFIPPKMGGGSSVCLCASKMHLRNISMQNSTLFSALNKPSKSSGCNGVLSDVALSMTVPSGSCVPFNRSATHSFSAHRSASARVASC